MIFGVEARHTRKSAAYLASLVAFVTGLFVLVPTLPALAEDCGTVPCADDLDLLLADDAPPVSAAETTKPAVTISVDDEKLVDTTKAAAGFNTTDEQLAAMDIQLKFDGLDVTKRLNVSTVEERRTALPDDVVRFFASTNYGYYIERAEIRIYRQVDSSYFTLAEPVSIVDLRTEGTFWKGGYADWQVDPSEIRSSEKHRIFEPSNQEWVELEDGTIAPRDIGPAEITPGNNDLVYTLRVYDRQGRFDETEPRQLKLTDQANEFTSINTSQVPGLEEDNLKVTNIPVYGGTVTVYGENVPFGHTVTVQGQMVAIDGAQKFVTSQILPTGDHTIDIAVRGDAAEELVTFERDIHIPDSEWFYVGLADLTIGRRFGDDSEALTPASAGEYSDTYQKGRLAFYLKGKIKGEYLITAAMDTTEEELDVLFSNLDEKDPRQLLRRLDPDDHYAVYGDDSTLHEDAPTSGRFYVRIERGESHVLWGNFKTHINGSDLAEFNRGLYGAKVHLETSETTTFGEPVAKIQGFAAQPGTLYQRDDFRGTGGSAYFLRRQDINLGSEQVFIEERDSVTGIVVKQTALQNGVDYDFDYAQGVILLDEALPSTTLSSKIVSSGALDGNPLYLVVNYEYTPTLVAVDEYAFGGRAEAWLANRVRVGVTGYNDNTGTIDQSLIGLDVILRLGEKSNISLDWARSDGTANPVSESTNGGFLFSTVNNTNSGPADAWRVAADIDLAEATDGKIEGRVGGLYEHRDAGFSSPGRFTNVEERIASAYLEAKPSDDVTVKARLDDVVRGDGSERRDYSGEVEVKVSEKLSFGVGAQHSDTTQSDDDSIIGTDLSRDTGTGARTDIAARITYAHDESFKTWVFGQTTVARDRTRERNDRVGIGTEFDITDKLSFAGEVSDGSSGVAVQAQLNYAPTASDQYYIGHRYDPDSTKGSTGTLTTANFGNLVFGAKRKINENLSAYMEENYDFSGSSRSLVHAYGVTYTPDPLWTLTGAFEAGEVYDDNNDDLDRLAVSGSIAYKDERKDASLRLEARFEDSPDNPALDRNTWLATSNTSLKHDDNWRFIASADLVISESDQGSFLDGDYIEASVGWAYRPVDNDRFNALFKYTYLHDLPGPQQVNSADQALGPKQRSHVLSADFIYDLTEQFSVGAKYGYRTGEISLDRDDENFTRSSAHLGIIRFDYHVVKNWDIFAEGRVLWLPEAEQRFVSPLLGVYRHFGDNLKIGVGYNFGRFSDDLTDLTYDDQGVFLNIVGKF